jgi:hypothetical protein
MSDRTITDDELFKQRDPEGYKFKVISDKNKTLADAQRLLQNISNSDYNELINMNKSNRGVKLKNLNTLIYGFRIAIDRNQDITTEIVNEQLRYIVPRGKFTELMNILKSNNTAFPLTSIEAFKIKGLRCAREFLYKTATECEYEDRLLFKNLGKSYTESSNFTESRNRGGKSRKTKRRNTKRRKTKRTRK